MDPDGDDDLFGMDMDLSAVTLAMAPAADMHYSDCESSEDEGAMFRVLASAAPVVVAAEVVPVKAKAPSKVPTKVPAKVSAKVAPMAVDPTGVEVVPVEAVPTVSVVPVVPVAPKKKKPAVKKAPAQVVEVAEVAEVTAVEEVATAEVVPVPAPVSKPPPKAKKPKIDKAPTAAAPAAAAAATAPPAPKKPRTATTPASASVSAPASAVQKAAPTTQETQMKKTPPAPSANVAGDAVALASVVAPNLYAGTKPAPKAPKPTTASGAVAAAPAPKKPATMPLERFGQNIADVKRLALENASLSTVKGYYDSTDYMEITNERRRLADRTPEERAAVTAAANTTAGEIRELLHRGGDHLEVLRRFYGIGVLSEKILQALPSIVREIMDRKPAHVPILMRSTLNRAMLCWVEGESEDVRACSENESCYLHVLFKTKEHEDICKRGRVSMPGRALYTPEEEAAGCTAPRQCYYCTVLTTNYLYNYFQAEGGCSIILNAFRVATSVPREFPPGSVLEPGDGLPNGIYGAFPFSNPQQLVAVHAATPTSAFGFVLGVPIF